MDAILAQRVDHRAVYIIGVCLLLLGVFFVLSLGIWYYRRRRQAGDSPASSVPWTLDDLRRLRNQGDLTEEEYQTLRANIIGLYSGESPPETPIPRQEHWDWVAPDPPENRSDLDVEK